MGRVIRVYISSAGAGSDTDAPTVDDLLDQLRDYFDILRNVEETMSEGESTAIDWRIVGASKRSPIGFDIEAFSRNYAVNIDERASLTIQHAAAGLRKLQQGPERPPFFNEKALVKAERFFERVTNGLNLTELDHGEGLPQILVTPEAARVAARNTISILRPVMAKPYREVGSLEGTFQRVERDGHGRALLFIKSRLTGDIIKCIVSGDAREKVEQQFIGEIWRGRRMEVFGVLLYKSIGNLVQVNTTDVDFMRDREQLPQLEDIQDTDFTGGIISENYIEKLRDGELS